MGGGEVGVRWCHEPAEQADPRVLPAPLSVARLSWRSTRTSFVKRWTRSPPVATLATAPAVAVGPGRHRGRCRQSERSQPMQVVYERCCGLDVHKRTVVACRMTPSPDGTPRK